MPATTRRTHHGSRLRTLGRRAQVARLRNWKPGDRVTVHCNHVDDQDPSAHDDLHARQTSASGA